jgi:hypothetical protein
MSNTLLNPKIYANTMLKLLVNNLVMGRLVTTQFNNEFKKVGSTIYIKRPPEFVVREGQVAQVQDVIEGEAPIRIDRQRGVDIEFSSLEDTLTVDALLKSSIMNAQAAAIAQEIDSDLMECVLEFPNWVGTPGQVINTPRDFFEAPKRLDTMAVPGADRCGVLGPNDWWSLAGDFTVDNRYNADVNLTALQRARLPVIGNVQPYMTQSVVNLTTGSRAATGAAQVDGSNQNVTYLAISANDYKQSFKIKGLTAGHTIKRGEVFTADGCRAVNPRTKADTGFLYEMVVLEDAVADGSGEATLTIANPIIVDGPYKTVTAAPLNNAAIVWKGTANTSYAQNAVFHKSSIALVFAKLTDPFTGTASYATDPGTGVTVRYWRTSDGINDTHMHRWDVLYGVRNVDRRLGTRISGTA